MNYHIVIIFVLALILGGLRGQSQEKSDLSKRQLVDVDSVMCDMSCPDTVVVSQYNNASVDTVAVVKKESGLKRIINKVIDYFGDANKEHPDRAFDISFIGGPHYSSEEGFGIGLAGSGRYKAGKNWRNDTVTPYSNITLKLDVATAPMYKIGVEGYHIFPNDPYRLVYDVYFYKFRDKFWGMGYENNRVDANETSYSRLQSQAYVNFAIKLRENVFLGPTAMFSYVNANKFEESRAWLFDGQSNRTFTTGLGFTFMVDTRDIPTGPTNGFYLKLDQQFNPRFMANKYAYSMTEFSVATYKSVWKGGIIAPLLHGRFTYGNTPWGMMSYFGGGNYMRGYYEGRYRDKNELDVTIELRQHVWRRNGIVVWLSAGTVFPRFDAMRFKHILPNAGIGYRWEFKKGVNVRLDIGFGKGEKGINFGLNEAF